MRPRLARVVRLDFTRHPAGRGTGGRVGLVAAGRRHIRGALPLTWRTRNIVGSRYGGALFAITDDVHPMMLMAAPRQEPELERTFLVELKAGQGIGHANVERTVYIAEKTYYSRKTGGGEEK